MKFFVAFVTAVSLSAAVVQDGAELPAQPPALPNGWQRTREVVLERPLLERLGARLGAPIVAGTNEFIDVGGIEVQVNRLVAGDEAGAQRLALALGANGRERFVAGRGLEVFEFARMNAVLASAVRHGLGFPDEEPVTWRATFDAVCVDVGDDRESNAVYELCLSAAQGLDAEVARARIAALTEDWTFGHTLRLAAPTHENAIEYTFEPSPRSERREGDVLVVEFDERLEAFGLPYVRVSARIVAAPWYGVRGGSEGAVSGGCVETATWPTTHAAVLQLVERLTTPDMAPRAKCAALFDHVARAIHYGGERIGSRDGVPQVLAQGFGRCWDKSDVLVTLLRAAGIEARQVAGWLADPGTGHVWVEARLPSEAGTDGGGWVALDPTNMLRGVSRDYVPWFRTDDGHMPIVYVTLPRVEIER